MISFEQSYLNTVDTRQPPKIQAKCIYGPGTYKCLDANFDLSILKKTIETLFENTEGIRYVWNSKGYFWDIEYGTRHLYLGKPGKEITQIKLGMYNAMLAAMKAQEKNRVEDNEDEEDFPEPISIFDERYARWCHSRLHVYVDFCTNLLIIYIHRNQGDRIANHLIWKKTLDAVKKEALFLERKSYLELSECGGAQFENSHIVKYVLDDMIIREVCSYMPTSTNA
jgi:hypothetical protein